MHACMISIHGAGLPLRELAWAWANGGRPAGLTEGGGAVAQGAVELAPGTKIFTGGIEAVVDAVLDGTRSPLDFRWFVGRRADVSAADGAWCPIACARPVALKQCLGLPKPLWHEVMELAGGELAEVSKVELLKRTDLQNDEGDGEA